MLEVLEVVRVSVQKNPVNFADLISQQQHLTNSSSLREE